METLFIGPFKTAEDGSLEPFDPRVHPEPWTERLARRERRRRARRGVRGRRGCKRVPRAIQHPADRMPEMVRRFQSDYALGMRSTLTTLRVREYMVHGSVHCPLHGRGAHCGERCWSHREHAVRVVAMLFQGSEDNRMVLQPLLRLALYERIKELLSMST